MKSFNVLIPIAGCMRISVEAESEEKALEAAYEEYHKNPDAADLEWEFCETVTEGNVLHAPYNSVEIEEEEEE